MKLEDEIKQVKFNDAYHKLLVNIMFTGSWLNIRQIHFFKQFDVSPQQYNILRILKGQYPKPATVNLLIDRMLDKMSNASRLVDKLHAKGFVERKQCKGDKRQVDVMLSKKGIELLDHIAQSIRQFEQGNIMLSQEESQTLSDLLDKMRG